MKIVICYSVGDGYTWSADIVKCFEYESTEAFLCGFEASLNAAIERQRRSEKVHEKYDELKSKFVIDSKTGQFKNTDAVNDWYENRPPYDSGEFVFLNCEFRINEFYHISDNPARWKDSILLPDVYELNEWFENNKATPI